MTARALLPDASGAQASPEVCPPEASGQDVAAREIAAERAYVTRVYAEVDKAIARTDLVHAEGVGRGQTEYVGEARDWELTGLFERDAMVYHAAKRRSSLDSQHEGLVFGRLDFDFGDGPSDGGRGPQGRQVRYIGRLGVRDDNYDPLVIDWRAPAAAAFYRATPVEPLDVLRRRVIRSQGRNVVGVEDDLMVAEPPEDLVVVGDGALLAALTRSRGARMRDIVATIQAHQDEAIRAPARGVTEITGGPGTGKTVVALHRAAYLLYSDRRRFESGGILVVGPSGAYTAYIERVLPSLGENSVALRALGSLVSAIDTERLDSPEIAAIKGSITIRRVLGKLARSRVPDAPTEFRAFVGGHALRLDARVLDKVRAAVLRSHPRNLGFAAAQSLLGQEAWRTVPTTGARDERAEFLEKWEDSLEVDAFMQQWWPQLDPREVLLWLADDAVAQRCSHGALTHDQAALLAASMRTALATGEWSVADVALVDDLIPRLGPVQAPEEEERGFYEIEELDARAAAQELGQRTDTAAPHTDRRTLDPRERLLARDLTPESEYAHVLVDEAQDLSPMQWRALGRRGRSASWTVVGDAAQASWPDPQEAARARDEAFGGAPRRHFRMTTNYRNAREIFDYAAKIVRQSVPDADIPEAVRETGFEPQVRAVDPAHLTEAVRTAVIELLGDVDGSIAVITPSAHRAALAADVAALAELTAYQGVGDRVVVTDPMSTKGLEYDATIVVDPAGIIAESPGGARVLYVAHTRAAHRMTVLELS